MITYKQGNLLDTTDMFIAHGVNCQGVMGAGVALALRKAYPLVFEYYDKFIKSWVRFGADKKRLLGYAQPIKVIGNKTIFNCFTQETYGRSKKIVYVDYDAVEECFCQILTYWEIYHVPMEDRKLSMPKIGCGLANGDWSTIEKLIKLHLDLADVTVWEID